MTHEDLHGERAMIPLYFPKAYFFPPSLSLLKFIAVLSLQPFDKTKFLRVTSVSIFQQKILCKVTKHDKR